MKAAALTLGLMAALLPAALPAPAAAAEEAALEAKEAALRREYHNPLNALVVFIHDEASAKAAAPYIAALLATPEGGKMALPDYSRITCYSYDFFGSPELKEALLPALKKEPKGLAKVEQRLGEAISHLDAVTAALGKVRDADSEAFAIISIEDHIPAAGDALLRASSAATANQLGACAFKAHGLPMLALDRLLHAYGRAMERMGGNCPALTEALDEQLLEHMEHTAFYDPLDVTPESIRLREAQLAALHSWFTIASTIHNKESADAAAAWLEKKNAEVGTRLQSSPHRKVIAACPALSLLEEAEANIYLYFANASPAYFGSERLAALYAEEEEAEGEAPTEPAPAAEPSP